MANKYVVHFEIDDISSAAALKAANAAWYAIEAVVGDKFDSAAECRDADGRNPRDPRWRGWSEAATVSYSRLT